MRLHPSPIPREILSLAKQPNHLQKQPFPFVIPNEADSNLSLTGVTPYLSRIITTVINTRSKQENHAQIKDP